MNEPSETDSSDDDVGYGQELEAATKIQSVRMRVIRNSFYI